MGKNLHINRSGTRLNKKKPKQKPQKPHNKPKQNQPNKGNIVQQLNLFHYLKTN